jgi:hypothetical protein
MSCSLILTKEENENETAGTHHMDGGPGRFLPRPLRAPKSNPLGTAKMNPDVSAIVDMFYTNDDTKEGIGHVQRRKIAGLAETPGMVEEVSMPMARRRGSI